MPSEVYGAFALIGLFALLACGVHVGIALGLVGFFGLVAMLHSFPSALGILTTTPYFITGVWALTCVPLFILMGVFAMHAGISRDVFDAAHRWMGRMRGGLAMATIVANAGFGAVCGSSLVAAAVFTKISLPEMVRHGYQKAFACGTIVAGGMLAMLIPPSILMVIYGILSEQSVGMLLIAGVGPGLVLGGVFCIACYVWVRRNPALAPVSLERVSLRDKLKGMGGTWGVLVLGGIIIGGIYGGIFSPTEAGAAGAAGAFILALGLRKLTWQNLGESMREGARITALVFLILVGAGIFSRFLAITRLPSGFANWVVEAGMPKYAMVTAFIFLYLILGCFLDSISMMSLTLPIIHPAILAMGWDPIWFAMVVVMAMELGLLTPPVGLNVYAVKAAAGDVVTLMEVFRGSFRFLLVAVVGLLIVIFVPEVSTFLPEHMMIR